MRLLVGNHGGLHQQSVMAKRNHSSVLGRINKFEHCAIRLAFLAITLFAIWKYLAQEWKDVVGPGHNKTEEPNRMAVIQTNDAAPTIPDASTVLIKAGTN